MVKLPSGTPVGRALGPMVAGTWYPDDPGALRQTVETLLGPPEPAPSEPPLALIAPHAGLRYSGAVAGRGFRLTRGLPYRRVILLGPSHYHAFSGGAVPEANAYRTPLGDVPLDAGLVSDLAARPGFHRSDEPFHPEHSLESEIPFLQAALPRGWTLVPVLVGPRSSGDSAQLLADALVEHLDPNTLVVVSSDFTHFGPRFGYVPFRTDVPRKIETLDQGAIARILAGDVEGFETYVAETGATICGRDAIDVLLRMLPAGSRGRLVAYDTSGRLTGDWNHSVSYASIVFLRGRP